MSSASDASPPAPDDVRHGYTDLKLGSAARRFLVPVVFAAAIIYIVRDPTYRFPLLTLVLPSMLRAAALAFGVHKPIDDESKIARAFTVIGFAGFVVGWLILFAIVVFGVTAALPGFAADADTLKTALLLAGGGLILGAWFCWPWYAADALDNWPDTGVRIATRSGSRWAKAFLSWRMQELAAARQLRLHGFGAATALVVCLILLAAAGAYMHFAARAAEVLIVLALPPLHLVLVREAHALCGRWKRAPTDAR